MLLVGKASDQSHTRDRVLVKIRFTKQVEDLMVHGVDDFQMCLNHGQVESSSKRNLTVYLLLYWDHKLIPRNYDLNFHYWEACLVERRPVLAQYDLTFFWVFLCSVKECEGRYCKILLPFWNQFGFLVFWTRGHHDEFLLTTPRGCYYVQIRVFFFNR